MEDPPRGSCSPAPPEPPDAFDEPWRLLTGEAAGGPGELGDHQGLVDHLAPLVLDHFSRNRPAPTSFPALAVQIMDLLNDPEVDLKRVLKAIAPDPAVSLHILRAANSPWYSRGTEVLDMRMAVMIIGLRGVSEIAAGVAARSLFDVSLRVEYEVFEDRWRHLFLDTMAVAFGASQFAFEQQVGRADRVFLGGMFHDIGKCMALRSLAALTIAGEAPPDLPVRVVDEVLERTHVEIGCVLHQLWRLPAHLSELCRDHHLPAIPDAPEHMDLHLLRVVSGVHRLILDPLDTRCLEETRQSVQTMRLGRRAVRLLSHELTDQMGRVAGLF